MLLALVARRDLYWHEYEAFKHEQIKVFLEQVVASLQDTADQPGVVLACNNLLAELQLLALEMVEYYAPKVHVQIHRAECTKNVALVGMNDSYVYCTIVPCEVQQFKTQVVPNTLQPTFEESCTFYIKHELAIAKSKGLKFDTFYLSFRYSLVHSF